MPQPWKNGLFNCMPFGVCKYQSAAILRQLQLTTFTGLKGTFCTCILVGQNHARIQGEQEPDACSGWCVGWCGLTSCLGAGWILQMMDRIELNKKYGTSPNSLSSCCSPEILGLMMVANRPRRWSIGRMLQIFLVQLLRSYSDEQGVGLCSDEPGI